MIESNKQTNILFIMLPYLIKDVNAKNSKIRSYEAFPYGILSIITYLRKYAKNKVNIKIIDCNLYSNEETTDIIKQNLLEFEPDIVSISMIFDSSYKHLEDISRTIKENSNKAVVVLGGVSASLSYKIIINEQEYIDAICYLEGEIPITKLVNCGNTKEELLHFLENDMSWITKKSIKERRIPKESFVKNLDDVVNIDYSDVDVDSYEMREAFSPFANKITKNKRQFFLVTSRGCPYKCVFCSSSTVSGKTVRYASVDTIIAHVKYLISKYGMNILTITDDQLLSNKKRAKELFEKLSEFNLRVECATGVSVAFIDDEMAYLMKKAGVDTVVLAIESGSSYMLKNIIHKPLKLEMIKPIIKILRRYNFFIEGLFVIGIPGEKEEHRKETMSFIKDVELDWSVFSLATPWRGNQLYEICVDNNYISKDLKIGEIEMDNYIIKTHDLNPEDIIKERYLMNLYTNFVDNYRMKIGDYQTAIDCFQEVIKGTVNHAFAYYYLALAQQYLNMDKTIIKDNYAKFNDIISKDNTWKEYTNYFNLSHVLICSEYEIIL